MRKIALFLMVGIAFTATAAAEPNAAEQLFQFHYEAAKGDNPESMYILANMYEGGRGVKQNYDEAIKWYSKAVKFGINRAATKIQEVMQKKAQAFAEAAELARKKRAQQVQQEIATQLKRQQQQTQLLEQRDAEAKAAEQAKADAERAALLLQQQIETAKMQTEKALKEAEKIRAQQEQLAREKAQLEQLRQSLLEQEQQQFNADTNNTDLETQQESAVKEFKADPCDGPSARFMSTCR